jgi:hypothetical protein
VKRSGTLGDVPTSTVQPTEWATDAARFCRPFHGLDDLVAGVPRVPLPLHPGLLSHACFAGWHELQAIPSKSDMRPRSRPGLFVTLSAAYNPIVRAGTANIDLREEVMRMGTKLGAWMTRCPFHKGGKLPAGALRLAVFRALTSPVGKGWRADGPWPMRGAVSTGCPDATAALL